MRQAYATRGASKAEIDEFVSQPALAVVGVSRSGKKFGNMAYRELRAKGYRLYPIHPSAQTIEGERCYSSLGSLPEPVGGVLIVLPPAETERVIRDVAASGIRRVWMQQGAESKEAIEFCRQNGITEVHGECILMFAHPTAWFHRMHRWLNGLLGKLPN